MKCDGNESFNSVLSEVSKVTWVWAIDDMYISESFYVLSEVSEVSEVTELTWVWEVDEMVSSDSF